MNRSEVAASLLPASACCLFLLASALSPSMAEAEAQKPVPEAATVAATSPGSSPAARDTNAAQSVAQSMAQEDKGGKGPDEGESATTLRVSTSGAAQYRTIQQAVDAAPADGALILIAPGTYREAVSITRPNIRLRGTGADPSQTVIVDDRNAGENGGTLHSATVEATGDGFRAENLTLQNDFNRTHPQLYQGSQALALMLTADRAVLRNVHLLGNQDTLYVGSKHCAAAPASAATAAQASCPASRSYFSHCLIAGNVDFIFGDGDAVFDHCEIRSTAHSEGFLTAQSRNAPTQDSAYVFNHCTLTAEPGVANVYLGRPWRPYATVIYLNTEMGAHINPAGWREWHPGETHSLDTACYAEYNSTGPGAHPGQRDPHARQLTSAEAAKYQTKTFLAGSDHWDPAAVR